MMPGLPDSINCVIFDFYGTLCSQHYFEALGPAFVDMVSERVFGAGSESWADPWMEGKISRREIADFLARHSTYSAAEIVAALEKGCRKMRFNPGIWNFAIAQRKLGRRTALVTGNMDVFSDIVVPSHRLDKAFDVIMNTSDHGTLRKEILWGKAFGRFGAAYGYSSSLLIDDSESIVELFRSLGGFAHKYTDDATLTDWLKSKGGLHYN